MINCDRDCLNCPYPEMPEACENLPQTQWERSVITTVREDLKKDALAAQRAERRVDPYLRAQAQAHIARAREARGMSRSDLAAAIGCSYQTILAWENGRYNANWKKLLTVLPELEAVYEDVAKYERSFEDCAGAQAWIARVRKARGMKQAELAAAIGCSAASLCRWEKGVCRADWNRLCAVLPELEKYRPREETEQCGRY